MNHISIKCPKCGTMRRIIVTGNDLEDRYECCGRVIFPLNYKSFLPEFESLKYTDSAVGSMLRCGNSFEEIIIALVREKRYLQTCCEELEAIAPKKIKTSDGKIYVWRCPDELIPIKEAVYWGHINHDPK